MNRWGVQVGLVALLLVGLCAGCGDGTDWSARGPTEEEYAPDALALGRPVYGESCATCHATDGSGGFGPSLRGKGHKYTYDEQRQIIERGKRSMPGFGASLTEQEIDALLAHVRVGVSDDFGD